MKLTGKLLTTGLVVGSTLGTLAIANKLTETQAGELDTVLRGEERRYPCKYGDVFYLVKGVRDAKPLLLIHDFAPGASSYEWRKNIDVLAEQYRVYALDLLGFGLSDRPAIDYTPETFTDLIGNFLKEVIGKPTTVVAHGLTCAYVISEAYRNPQLFERLVLVSPPATIVQETTPGPLNVAFKFVLRTPLLGQFIYNILTSRRAIRSYYNRESYVNPTHVTDDMVEYLFTSAHQSNSRYPMASFLTNHLTTDMHEVLAGLQVPVVAIWGRQGPLTPTEATATFKGTNSRIDIRILDNCSQQLQDEQSTKFNTLIREFASATVRQ